MKKSASFDSKETIAANVAVSEMVIDDYQGHVNQALVDKIAKAWDDSASGAIVLNLREDNTYAVLDGQHRYLAAKKVGKKELNALVFIGKTKQEEARLFVQLNTKHNVKPYDRFNANMIAGNLRERNIKAVLKEFGMELCSNPYQRNGVRCVNTLTRIYDEFGLSMLREVTGILQASFSEYPDSNNGYVDAAFWGVTQMLYRYKGMVDVKRLISKLKTRSPRTINGIAAMRKDPGQSGWIGWGRAMTVMYNDSYRRNSKNYLPMDRWDHQVYTPAAKIKVQENARKQLAKVGGVTRFKAGHKAHNKGLKLVAKTKKEA